MDSHSLIFSQSKTEVFKSWCIKVLNVLHSQLNLESLKSYCWLELYGVEGPQGVAKMLGGKIS